MRILAACVIAALLVGCGAHSGRPIDRDAAASIQKGVTTKDELIERMGKPNVASLMGDGRQSLMWVYVKSKVDGKTFIPFAGAFVGGVNTDQQTFQAIIDKDGIVQETLYNTSSTSTKPN